MVIMKFGGTSVENATAIQRVAEIVRSRQKLGPVVIVSAFAKVTDQLVLIGQKAAAGDVDSCLQLWQTLRERHLATAEELLGERLSTKIAPKLMKILAQLEEFLRGVAAVKELSPRSSDYLLS